MIFRKFKIIIFIGFLSFFISACQQNNNEDLVQFVNNTFKGEKPEIEPLPPIVPYEEFIYAASNLPDPFAKENVLSGSSDTQAQEDSVEGIDLNRRKEPLEAFPLDSLRLDGILEFRGQVSAIIRSPDGDSVPVSVGDYMGLNSGKIISIRSEEQSLDIEETVRNATGVWIKRAVTISSNDPS